MLKLLKEKIVLLYTLTNGLILTIVMIIILGFTEKNIQNKQVETFQNNINTIITQIKFENSITDTWLSQMEAKNHLLIHIADNNNSLSFSGAISTPTDRDLLFNKLCKLALSEGINTRVYPVFSNELKSSIVRINGTKRDFYYGCVVIIPTTTGWRSIEILNYLPNYLSSIRNQRLVFIIIGISGILILYLVNLSFVSKMIKPIAENNEKQTRFIASASHELRSPLAVISANNANIPVLSDDVLKFTGKIDNECKRMARLIDDMLLLASTDAKSWSLKKEVIETDTLLIETYEAFLPICLQKDINLLLDIPEIELPNISVDKQRLQQILAILLDNAITYTPAHKNITLRSYSTNKNLYIKVEDQGIGVKDEHKRVVFERFYRIDQSRNDKQHYGLGLSIAKELVELQGGKIYIHNTLGGGATFIIHFKVS